MGDLRPGKGRALTATPLVSCMPSTAVDIGISVARESVVSYYDGVRE